MELQSPHRHLSAIVAVDVAGYSRLMADDEEGTLARLTTYRDVASGLVDEHEGRIFGACGDSMMVDFASATLAVRAAVAIQRAIERRNADLSESQRMRFRIGINVGDVFLNDENLYGEAVNVAARLQELAPPAGVCITASVYEQIKSKVEFPVAQLGERTLKNIPYPVQVFRIDPRLAAVDVTGLLSGAPALPDKPSIAVLPFANLSGDASEDYFVDGITDDITTALSRHRWFFVIARNSTFAYKNRSVDVRQIARELGVRFILEGSARRANHRLRVTGQLIDAESGAHLWAERFDREVADIFAIQDEITQSVTGAIEPQMLRFEAARAARKSPANLDAFDSWLRAHWHFHKFEREDNEAAEEWLNKALHLDPGLAQAHVLLARMLCGRVWWGWSVNLERDVAIAYEAGRRAVALDDRDPSCHYALFLVSLITGRLAAAMEEAQRAIDLNPNFALGHFALGWTRVFTGSFAEAVDAILVSLRLNPTYSPFHGQIALAYYHLQNYQEAASYAERGLRTHRMYPVLQVLVASLGQLGRKDEARPYVTEMRASQPRDFAKYLRIVTPYQDISYCNHLFDGLQKAGMTDFDIAN